MKDISLKSKSLFLIALSMVLSLFLTACPSGSGATKNVTAVTISPDSLALEIGETQQLTATVTGSNLTAADKTVTWASADTAIATVTDGLVTAVAEGQTTITATSTFKQSVKDMLTVTVTAAQAQDSDADGLSDELEADLGTDPNKADTDDDGTPDATEVGDPNNPTDSDGDGKIDAIESSTADRDGDGKVDQQDDNDSDGPLGDFDGDTLTNAQEATLGTNPQNWDSDGDDARDGDEVGDVANPTDSDGDGKIDALESSKTDADEDGTSDQADPKDNDPCDPSQDALPCDQDVDGLTNGRELEVHTDPTDPDSDDDGLNDGAEVNSHQTDPNDTDSDDDNLSDGVEVHTYNTDPTDPDSDDDGVNDGDEVDNATNPNDSASKPIVVSIQGNCDQALALDDVCSLTLQLVGTSANFSSYQLALNFEQGNFDLLNASNTGLTAAWPSQPTVGQANNTLANLGPAKAAPGALVNVTIQRVGLGADRLKIQNIIFPDIANVKGGVLNLAQGVGEVPELALSSNCAGSTAVDSTCTVTVNLTQFSGQFAGFQFDVGFANSKFAVTGCVLGSLTSAWTGPSGGCADKAHLGFVAIDPTPAATGPGEILKINLKRLATGVDTIMLDDILIADPSGQSVRPMPRSQAQLDL